jgi:transcriptional regulator with XRE-family HTH domain
VRYRLNTERLARLLAASRISQNHWALRLGLSRGHWSDIVNGKHPYLSAKTRERMTEVFGVSDLFTVEPSNRGPDVDFRIAVSGRYELAAELGQGGMGTVYQATDIALGRLVALKVVSAEAAGGVGPDQLLKEIAHVSRLQHPHILPLHDAGLGAGSPFYVMPLVRGGSLGARLRVYGALPLAEVTRLVQGIAAGLAHAHDHRVLHCDIKPENILLDGSHTYVMDFGIARTLHAEADEWSGLRKELDFSAGTPAYVSPEQAAGNRTIDERSDVYSLACVVYEMLAGRAPFSGENTREVVSLRFREPPPPLQRFAPDVPDAVVRVIQQAMSLNPDERPAGAKEFARALETAAQSVSPARAAVWFAARRARRSIGSLVGLRPTRAARTRGVTRWIESLTRDIAYGVRQRRRSPTLTAVSLLTLALAIGLTTSVWAVTDGLLLRPLPFASPDRLVALQSVDSLGNPFSRMSSANWYDLKRENGTLEGDSQNGPHVCRGSARGHPR